MVRGLRSIAAVVPPDRKTIRRMIDVAVGLGLDRDDGPVQLNDEFMSLVMAELAMSRPDRHGESWATIADQHEAIAGWVKSGVPVVKMREFLVRRGVVMPERTLHRYVAERFGLSLAESGTVPVADCDPGAELQVDWVKLGALVDAETGRRRAVWAFLSTSVFSRHCFVWLSFSQALDSVIAGFDAAWAFVEYAQWAGFFVDPARVRAPQDEARGAGHVVLPPRRSGRSQWRHGVTQGSCFSTRPKPRARTAISTGPVWGLLKSRSCRRLTRSGAVAIRRPGRPLDAALLPSLHKAGIASLRTTSRGAVSRNGP